MGSYTAGAYAVGLSYGKAMTDKFAIGASLKYVNETIDNYHADNIITDIGFLYHIGVKSFRIGSFLQNFGLESKYADEKFKMPQQLKLGISAEAWGSIDSPSHVTILAEAIHPNDAPERIHIGIESVFAGSVILRGGYKFFYDQEDLCFGGGLRFKIKARKFGIDFAYMNHEHLDTTFRYTLVMEY
jgi:hypothetical protein